MDTQEIKMKIREIIEKENVLTKSVDAISDSASFIDEGVDSLRMVILLTAVEVEFGFDIPPHDFNFENFINIQKLAAYIESKVSV